MASSQCVLAVTGCATLQPHRLPSQQERSAFASAIPPLPLPRNQRTSVSSCSLKSSFAGSKLAAASAAIAPRRHQEQRGSRGVVVCGLFGLGLPELLVIGGVAVVLFGPKQLPEIGKSLGKTVKGFQEAAQEFQTELKKAASSDEAASGESAATGAAEGAETKKPVDTSSSASATPTPKDK